MSDSTIVLNLPYIQASQAQKHVTHNEAIRALDIMVQLSVSSRDLTVPPVTPEIGARYLVGNAATGVWASQDHNIAFWDGVSWGFTPPKSGWLAWVEDIQQLAIFTGSMWELQLANLNNIEGLGIQSSFDNTNRLAVSSVSSLFNHAGQGHQLKINKNTVTDTASLLFQTGYSGRAEMGLAGNDTFSIKTSPDGAVWQNAVVVDGSGRVGMGQAPASETLEVAGNILADAHLTPSDARLKTNVTQAAPVGELIDQMSVVSFDWITGGSVSHGLIAQQLAEVFPDAVHEGSTDGAPWTIEVSRLVPVLLQEVKSLRERLSAAGL